MTSSLVALILIVGVIIGASSTLASHSMLPDHPGYQMGPAIDSVHGLSIANDLGRSASDVTTASREAAAFHDVDAMNAVVEVSLSVESQGAGERPKTIGYPDSKMDPPVLEAINPIK